jgi:uncharacterized protein (TIGR00251 family)
VKRISVKVLPRSSQNKVVAEKEIFKVKLTAPPVGGAANEALIKVLAEYFDVKKSQIKIISGNTSRMKIVEIS